MFAILHALEMFVADLFKSRSQLEAFDEPFSHGLQPTKLLAPALIRHLGHADLADRIGNALIQRHQNINLSKRRNDLFQLAPLPRHNGPP
jgi:hypothetical protein